MADEVSPDIVKICNPRQVFRARLTGALFRVAYLLSTAMPGLLPEISFVRKGDIVTLCAPENRQDFMGERLARRLEGLSEVAGVPVVWD